MNEIIVAPNAELREDAVAVSSFFPVLCVLNSRMEKLQLPENVELLTKLNQMAVYNSGRYELVGKEVDAVCLAYRSKASFYTEGEFETVLSGVDSGGDPIKYADYRAKAKARVNGYKYGIEWLFYLPEFGEYVTVFHGTDFERSVGSSKILDGLDAQNNKFILYSQPTGPKAKYKRTVIAARQGDFEIHNEPEQEEVRDAIHRFRNPPAFISDPGDVRS
jgi:hypothetical protein